MICWKHGAPWVPDVHGPMDARAARGWAAAIERAHPGWRTVVCQNRPFEWWIHLYYGPTSDCPQSFVSDRYAAARLAGWPERKLDG